MEKVLFISICVLVTSCKFLGSKTKSDFQKQPEAMKVFDFCDPSYQSTSDDAIWLRKDIEKNLNDLVAKPPVYNTVMEAYPNAYITMTAQRDVERCGTGKLVSGYEISNYINHLLSDIMTRYLHKITAECSKDPKKSIENYGLCFNQKKFMQNPKTDTVSAFLDSTAVYISSHISLSLAAVILNDSFWDKTNYVASHSPSGGAVHDRVFYLKRYRPNFTAFNQFLADHLYTVSSALSEKCLTKGDLLEHASRLGKKMPFSAALFGKIRDKAFEEGIYLAKNLKQPDEHPMIVKRNGKYVIDYSQYDYSYRYPKRLKSLEGFSRNAVNNPVSRFVYDKLLGGMTSKELPVYRKTCK